MQYKEVIYQNYIKNHTLGLYGKNSISKIESHFKAWRYYYKSFLPQDKNASILDMGCGDGSFVYWLQKEGYSNATGIDISQQQIDSGKELGIAGIICADLSDHLLASEQKYDLIVARDVIEHFTKDQVFDILHKVNRSLKPDGGIMVQVPNGEGLFYTSIYYGDFTHEVAYTARSLQQIFLNCGFSTVSVKPVGPPPVGLISSMRWLMWKIISAIWRLLKVVETGRPQGIFTQNILAMASKHGSKES